MNNPWIIPQSQESITTFESFIGKQKFINIKSDSLGYLILSNELSVNNISIG